MASKIYLNHTLEEYNKKYKKYGNKLIKITKKEVEEFDKKNPNNIKEYLLKDRKWWLINDIYYEIPNNKVKVWWSNLGKGGQIALCVLGGATVATAVVVPTVIAINKKGETKKEAEIASGVQHVKSCELKENGNNYEITFSVDDGYEITGIEKITINGQEFKDFTFKDGKVIIAKEALNKVSGKIIVTPKIKDVTPPAIKLKEIKIAKVPNTTDYYYKDKLDLTGLKIEAVYDDESTKDITTDPELSLDIKKDYEFSKEDLGKAKTITATFKEKTASFDVNVIKFEDYLEFDDLNNKAIKIKDSARTSKKYPKNLIIPESMYNSTTKKEIAIEYVTDFENLDKVEMVDLSMTKSLKSLGSAICFGDGFKECKNLKKIVLNDGLEDIGECDCNNFLGCISLEEIEIPSTVKSIFSINQENSNFYNCVKLKTVTINNKYFADMSKYSSSGQSGGSDEDISIYEHATTVYVKDGITPNASSYIAKYFTKQDISDKPGYDKYCRNKYTFTDLGNNKVSIGSSLNPIYDETEILPDNDGKGNTVTEITDYGFYGNKSIENIVLPSTIKLINNAAFNSSSLKKITLNDGLESIGNSTFFGSTIEEINIPSSLTLSSVTGNYACFGDCNNLKTVVLDNQDFVDYVHKEEYLYCGGLYNSADTIYIKSGLNAPKDGSFIADNFVITKSDKEGYDKYIGKEYIFRDFKDDGKGNKTCDIKAGKGFKGGVTTLPDEYNGYKVTTIVGGDGPFCGKPITELITNLSMKTIGGTTFVGCYQLKKITLNDGIESIGTSSFQECTSLEEINIPSTLTIDDGGEGFGYCTLKKVTVDKKEYACITDNSLKLYPANCVVKVLTSITTQADFDNSYIKKNSFDTTTTEGNYTVFTIK